ncbi:alpha-L-arabinofuranosidase [Sediminibacterium roseum]|uniref:non-reducing end alpha-L-arabinofuranosidase n=1 Tax=Sediminibacterium roseum TaxID=1978412 RepID=A0ABW9ZUL3_9BACT|nr:alpha-L-arabinofuranosidase C-terminal domain-containing protein [Sediminibacterium roseum]NCI49437.1 alpha-L-arabinofuranosidase [Sediminibacterium roseum]
MLRSILVTACVGCALALPAQQHAVLKVNAGEVKNTVAPTLHGIFFEEISHGGEGGLYAELIQNRGFEESRIPPGAVVVNGMLDGNPQKKPHYNLNGKASNWKMPWPVQTDFPYWKLETGLGADISLALDKNDPLTAETPQSAHLSIKKLSAGNNYFANEGFWGIDAKKGETYDLSFYMHSDGSYKGPLTVLLLSQNGSVIASHTFTPAPRNEWKQYSCALVPSASDGKARFAFSFGGTGNIWFDFVSLFPRKTFMNRPNGVRADLGQYLADLKPAFVRWPGGCFVEGINVESAPNWKTSIGKLEKRPGTFSVWGYWSSDGFGFHEYLQFCEDIKADALYVFNAGVSCEFRSGTFIKDEDLQPVIDDVLDALEYAVGPVTSRWGKLRAANGHPKPFPLKYIEVGNEQHGPWYARRYNRFHEAIKSKYPGIKIISSMGIGDINKRTLDSIKTTDMADEHAYKGAFWTFNNYDHFDKYKRGDYEVYVGEYATNAGVGAGNMLAALNDAVYIMGMENNGDLVKMSSYAPLFENVNTRHWPVNLIKFKSDSSFARISYYTIQLMNRQRADKNLPVSLSIKKPEDPKPRNTGGIGLATWDTQTEYKDIEIVRDGKQLYKSDFVNRPGEWQSVRGNWQVQDGAIAQTVQGPQRLMLLKDKTFDTYTLKLKARKTSGTNAFIIPFAVNGKTMLRAHIGGLVNNSSMFELVMDESVSNVSAPRRLQKPIETGRWYDVRLEVGKEKVECYLDDQLLMTYTEPPKFITLAGRDAKSGDLIIKAANVSDEAYTTDIEIEGATLLNEEGTAFTISSDALDAENSFAMPKKYVPVRSAFKGVEPKKLRYSFPKYSITVLRIKAK